MVHDVEFHSEEEDAIEVEEEVGKVVRLNKIVEPHARHHKGERSCPRA